MKSPFLVSLLNKVYARPKRPFISSKQLYPEANGHLSFLMVALVNNSIVIEAMLWCHGGGHDIGIC